MGFRVKKKHMIDFIFPVALYFVFAVTALMVVILAADIYRSVTDRAGENHTLRTALSYICEKVRQNDVTEGVDIDSLEGTQCLTLRQRTEAASYTTYIYEYQGRLKELFLKDGAVASLESGADIMEIESFQVEPLTDSLFRMTITDEEGRSESVIVGIKSGR